MGLLRQAVAGVAGQDVLRCRIVAFDSSFDCLLLGGRILVVHHVGIHGCRDMCLRILSGVSYIQNLVALLGVSVVVDHIGLCSADAVHTGSDINFHALLAVFRSSGDGRSLVLGDAGNNTLAADCCDGRICGSPCDVCSVDLQLDRLSVQDGGELLLRFQRSRLCCLHIHGDLLHGLARLRTDDSLAGFLCSNNRGLAGLFRKLHYFRILLGYGPFRLLVRSQFLLSAHFQCHLRRLHRQLLRCVCARS